MSVGAARAHTALYVVSLIVAVIIICVGGAFVGLQWSWSAGELGSSRGMQRSELC